MFVVWHSLLLKKTPETFGTSMTSQLERNLRDVRDRRDLEPDKRLTPDKRRMIDGGMLKKILRNLRQFWSSSSRQRNRHARSRDGSVSRIVFLTAAAWMIKQYGKKSRILNSCGRVHETMDPSDCVRRSGAALCLALLVGVWTMLLCHFSTIVRMLTEDDIPRRCR